MVILGSDSTLGRGSIEVEVARFNCEILAGLWPALRHGFEDKTFILDHGGKVNWLN